MLYDWAKLVTEMRNAMIPMVSIEGQDKEHSSCLTAYFREIMRETDTFHNFDADESLGRAFRNYRGWCNYRSVASYWAHKRERESILYNVYDYFIGMEELIRDHFSNPMNFPPGSMPPKSVNFGDLEAQAKKVIPKIIRIIKL